MTEKKWRKDTIVNRAKVIKEVLKNPLASQREIAKKTWLWLWTVNRKLNNVIQISWSEIIDRICKNDRDLIDLVSGLNLKQIRKVAEQDHIDLNDLRMINDITKAAQARYTIFKWDITDEEWGLKLSEDEVKILDNLL